MKWVCIALLVTNAGFLGWELNTRIYHRPRPVRVEPIPANVAELHLLGDLAVLPPERAPAEDSGIGEPQFADDTVAADADLAEVTADLPADDIETELDPAQILGDEPAADDVAVAEPAFGAAAMFVFENPSSAQMQLSLHCFSFGPFTDEQDLSRRKVVLAGRVDWLRTEAKRDGERQKLFWVYLEPRESAAAAQQELAALQRHGITDYMIIRRGGLRNAISLGLFSSQESVNNRLAELADEGYQPVVVPRYKLTRHYWLHAGSGSPDLLETASRKLDQELAGRSAGCNEIAQLFPDP